MVPEQGWGNTSQGAVPAYKGQEASEAAARGSEGSAAWLSHRI